MRRRFGSRRALLTAASLLLLAACNGADGAGGEGSASAGGDTPARHPRSGPSATASAPEFSGEQAYELLRRQVEFGPRVPGTEGHAAQLRWMTEYLRERADTVVLQPFSHTLRDGPTLDLTNVFARFLPEQQDRILLVAHWDTRPIADMDPNPENRSRPIAGANDGASGVAVLLELADVLSSHSPPLGIDLLLVDGEDYATGEMTLGAEHFAANLPPGYAPLYGVVVDMVGDRDPRFPVEANSQRYAPEVVDRVWRVAEELGYGARFPRTIGSDVLDDHIPLNRAGIRTIDIIDFEYGPGNSYWHTLEDDLHNTSPAGLEMVGRVLTTLIYRGG